MQSPSYRTICEKCGRTTVSKLLSEVQMTLYQDGYGAPIFVMFCPEHRAAFMRLLSDFLEPDAPTAA